MSPVEETARILQNNYVIGDCYTLVKQIGSGSFGNVFLAEAGTENKKFAVKLERSDIRKPKLPIEMKVYDSLSKGQGFGIPTVHWYGLTPDSKYTALVLDRLGSSLNDWFEHCNRCFSLKTVLLLFDQIMPTLEFIHEMGYLHRDIKPANILMGVNHDRFKVYIVDFGLSDSYLDKNMKHKPNRGRLNVGTPLFASARCHFEDTPSRRDDLESLGYVLFYFLKGTLPWKGVKSGGQAETWAKVGIMKYNTTPEELCENHPDEFASYLKYCRALQYDEKPNYGFLREMFKSLAKQKGIKYNYIFDWTK